MASKPTHPAYIAQLLVQKVAASPFLAVLLLLAVICITTRLTSGRAAKKIDGDVKTATLLPHWIPILGNAWWLAFAPQKLEQARSIIGDGIFAISMGGLTHNMIVKPSLAKSIFQLRPTVIDNHHIIAYMMENFFGSPPGLHGHERDEYIFKEVHPVLNGLMKESYLARAMPKIAECIENNMPNLVSFDQSELDLNAWQRAAKAKVILGARPTAEVSFFPLIRTFAANIAIPTLVGTAFLERYPDIAQDIWDFDAGMPLFMMQLKPWLPVPSFWRACAARKRLRAAMTDLLTAMDQKFNGLEIDPSWKDLDGVAEVIWERYKAWSRSGVALDVWAGGEMTILWALNVNANNIIFWLLLRIYSSPPTLTRIRAEIAPYTTSPASKAPHSGPLKLNIDALTKSSPLLKAAYYESLRMDTGASSIKSTVADFTLTESAADGSQSYRIRKGEYIHVYHSLHQTDPRYFPAPEVFDLERFLLREEKDDGEGPLVAHQGSIRPFGGGLNLCKGYKFAEREILLFAAGILATWNVEPVGGAWKLPAHVKGSGAYLPAGDFRVRLTLRT